MRKWTNSEGICPQWETDWSLLSDSCCALHHSHNPSVLFISPVCFLSSHIDLAVSLYLYLLYIFSHLILHAHASEMRTSRGTGVGVSRWKEANLWLDHWVIERVKGQSSKAVSLSISLTQTRTNAKSGSQSQSYRVRSTRIGIQMHSYNHYFWWYLWDEDDKWQKSWSRIEVMSTSALYVSLWTQCASRTLRVLQWPLH